MRDPLRNPSRMPRLASPAALLLGLLLAAAAHAGDVPDADLTVYEPQAFAAAAPVNALDMVQRVPGFVLVGADPEVRGYVGAQGNVLIDGAHPASKRDDLEELLRRIPAASVARIERIRGGSGGIEMAGHAVVVNVVRRTADRSPVALEAGVAMAEDWLRPRVALEFGRRRDGRALELALAATPELDDDSGAGSLRSETADGAPLEDAQTSTQRTLDEVAASGAWRRPAGAGEFRLDGALRSQRDRQSIETLYRAPAPATERVREDQDYRDAEFGARYPRALGPRTTLELMASQQLGWLELLSTERDGSGDERFAEDTDSGESLARADWVQERSDTLTVVAGLEGAYNFLDSTAQLSEDGMPVEVPGSDVTLREHRAEASLGATWQPRADWTVDGAFAVEGSQIRQSGDSPLRRDFLYPKPRVAVSWQARAQDRLRASLARTVGQLDFEDFVASAALDTGVVSAGNAELEPDQTWRLAASWERSFWDDGALVVTLAHEAIDDVVDRVPISADGETFDAPGNIGDGTRDTASVELSASLDRLGLRGMRFASTVSWRRSEVTDPTTGATRGISDEAPREGDFSLSQTLPARRLAWGLSLTLAEVETSYRFDEVAREREGEAWSMYLERRFGDGWRLRAEASELFGRDIGEDRSLYDGPRSEEPLAGRERREHRVPLQFLLTLRRSTGG